MQEEFFMNSMEHDPKLSGEHGAQTRKSLALKAEEILGMDLEVIVADDDLMYDSLVKLKPLENPKKNPMQNALRKYYTTGMERISKTEQLSEIIRKRHFFGGAFLYLFLGGVTWELRVYLVSDRRGISLWIRRLMPDIRSCSDGQQAENQ